MINIEDIAKKAKNASVKMSALDTNTKNIALKKIAQALNDNKEEIITANYKDLTEAKKLVEKGEISQSTYNRLKLDDNKFRDMVQGVSDVSKLDDPVNKVLLKRELDENLILEKISCPIGVIGVIFEARPDVISQISSLAIKSGNVVILKGGKEAKETNAVIYKIINEALSLVDNFPENTINLIYTREEVSALLKMDKYIDLIIPRGGNTLVKYIKENTKIPVLGHADGICHIFTDKSADKTMAEKICIDSKTQYPSACNSVETILVHKDYPYLKELLEVLKENEVKVIGDEICQSLIFDIIPATQEDWIKEYGEKTVSVKVVNNIDEAIEHINTYGSHHTDAIITNDKINADSFTSLVDSAGVYVNASTRFADGFRYGFGAEVGISTNKTHARGPVGLDGLTIYKYKILGSGQIVDDYAKGLKSFTHKDITD